MNEVKWKYAKPLKSEDIIHEFEKTYNYDFPDDYIKHIVKYNNGRPDINSFSLKKEEYKIKKLLSFDKKAKDNIWQINEWCKSIPNNKYIIFAICNNGNYICFYKPDDSIKYINKNTLKVEDITSGFDEFLDSIH